MALTKINCAWELSSKIAIRLRFLKEWISCRLVDCWTCFVYVKLYFTYAQTDFYLHSPTDLLGPEHLLLLGGELTLLLLWDTGVGRRDRGVYLLRNQWIFHWLWC